MEHRASNHLEQRISQWKNALSLSHSINNECLLELESHLRDELEVILANGVDEDIAFNTVVKKLGSFQELDIEYEKVWDMHTIQKLLKIIFQGMMWYWILWALAKILALIAMFFWHVVFGFRHLNDAFSVAIVISSIGLLFGLKQQIYKKGFNQKLLPFFIKGMVFLFVSNYGIYLGLSYLYEFNILPSLTNREILFHNEKILKGIFLLSFMIFSTSLYLERDAVSLGNFKVQKQK